MKRTVMFCLLVHFLTVGSGFTQLVQPSDFQYLGAFRLPEGSNGSDWNYSGYGAAYYPEGDPKGPNDGYPGSIFAIGHDQQQYVSEISIPIPKVSAKKNPAELNTASTLQGFKNIKGNLFGELEVPRADLEYMPALGGQTTGKLHFCWGQHFQFDRVPSHGWCNITLSNPQTAGSWFMGNYTNYITNDYLFEIPEAWSTLNVKGQRLATGRFRDGGWGGRGPALLAYNPLADGNPPAKNVTLSAVTLLLLYGEYIPGTPEISNSETMKMKYYKDPDEWSGGAWLTAGANTAVIFVGTKAMGKCWYGFSNGVVYPTDGIGPFPPVPPPPHDQRGWWADSIQVQILFYNPSDLADVARGRKKSYEPQPYAVMNLNPFMFDPGYDYFRYKMASIGDCCYDRTRNVLYLFERLADEDKSLVHAFRVRNSGTGVREPGFGDWDSEVENRGSQVNFRLEQNFPNPFNPSTAIRFSVAEPCRVVMKAYDIMGREMSALIDGYYSSGEYTIQFNAAELPSGIYVYRIQMGGFAEVRKMFVLK